MMKILKPHVSLNVSSIEASVAFYERAFGVKASKLRHGYAKFDLEAPALNLTMQEGPRTGINASHFGVQVEGTEDVMEAKRRFEGAGLPTFTEKDTACCYAVQDKVWIEDPDGNAWEVFVVKGDAPAMNCSSSPCCVPDVATEAPATSSCCAPKLGHAG
jgi:catechol 2,3-dioxygenase-like lactoylglutathione lyase family enzyme